MEDIGGQLRQLGQDIGGAFLEPVKIRLQLAEMKRERDKENKKEAAKTTASEVIGRTRGAEAQAFFDAGEFPSYVNMREVDVKEKAARAKGSGEGGDGAVGAVGGRYLAKLRSAQVIMDANYTALGTALEEKNQAHRSKDPERIKKADATFAAISDSAERVKNLYTGLARDVGMNDKELDNVLSKDTNKTNLISDAVWYQSGLKGSIDKKLADHISEAKKEYGAIDISGIASSSDADAFKLMAVTKGDMTKGAAMMLQDTNDPDALSAVANDKEQPMATRKYAAIKYIRSITSQAIFSNQQNLSVSDLYESQKNANTPEDEIKAVVSKRILGSRGYAEDRTLGEKLGFQKQGISSTPSDVRQEIADQIKQKKDELYSLKPGEGGGLGNRRQTLVNDIKRLKDQLDKS